MTALALMIKPAPLGWGVYLTDGRQLARFFGPLSQWRARRYLARAADDLRTA